MRAILTYARMISGLAVAAVAVTVALLPAAALADGLVYWADPNNGNVHRANANDGTGVEELIAQVNIAQFALDVGAQKIYWYDVAGEVIVRSDLDGGSREVLLPAVVGDLALDLVGGRIYFTDTDNGKIQRTNLDGTGLVDLVTGLTTPYGIALDLGGGKMYWADRDEREILRANLNGSDPDTLVSGLVTPAAVALDLSRGKVYWSDPFGDKIQRANLDGGGVEDVHTGLLAGGIALDTTDAKIYWTEPFSQLIRRSDLDGKNTEDLVNTPGGGSPVYVVLDKAGDNMYWSDPSLYVLNRVAINGGIIDPVMRGIASPAGLALDPKGNRLYWTDTFLQAVYRSDQDGTGAEFLVGDLTGGPVGIGVDTTGERIFWANPGDGTIKSADLDGSNVQTEVDSYAPLYVALDAVSRQLYWTDQNGFIFRGTEGSLEIDTLVSGLTDPRGIALDVDGGGMYWADDGDQAIFRADLNGNGVEELLPGLTSPRGIGLDVGSGKLYWTDSSEGVVGRANLDGSDPEDLVAGAGSPMGLAVDPDPYVPALLQSFAASNVPGGVKITWRMREVDANTCFFLLRADVSSVGGAAVSYRPLRGVAVTGAGLAFRALDHTCRSGAAYRYRVDVTDASGRRVLFETGAIVVPAAVTRLRQNHPNPFNPSTTISFVLPHRSPATLAVYSAAGEWVRTLWDGPAERGVTEVTWDGRDAAGVGVSSGVYFYRLRAGSDVLTRKMLLLR